MKQVVNNTEVNYEIIGTGKPVLIIHGYYQSIESMKPSFEQVFESADGYKRIYIDLPGMGKTKSSEAIKNSDDMLNVLIQFIDAVIPEEEILIVGESYGGYLARGLVNKIQNRVYALLLVCPMIIPNRASRKLPNHEVLVEDIQLLNELSDEDGKSFSTSVVIQSLKIYKRYKNEIANPMKLADKDFLENIRKNGYGFSFDPDNLESDFDKPALFLLGINDSVVGYEDIDQILGKYPLANTVYLYNAGHNLKIEQEEKFNNYVKEWLCKLRDIDSATIEGQQTRGAVKS